MSTAETLLANPPDKTPPEGLGTPGLAFWHSVVTALDLEPHETVLLVEVVRTIDVLDHLDATVRREGAMIQGKRGPEAHPAAREARAQRITLSRLLATLRLPDDWSAPDKPTVSPSERLRRPQRRGAARSPYSSRDRTGPL